MVTYWKRHNKLNKKVALVLQNKFLPN